MGVNPNDPNMVRAYLYPLLGSPSTVAMGLIRAPYRAYIRDVDANHDELATVPSANVQSHVASCHP